LVRDKPALRMLHHALREPQWLDRSGASEADGQLTASVSFSGTGSA
jgi:hypothetical protein